MHGRNNQQNPCKAHINFTLCRKDLVFSPDGVLTNIKYQRSSFMAQHSHDLMKNTFLKPFSLVKFLEEDLHNFGSNTRPAKVIGFAKNKYGLDLKYNQVYWLLTQLKPIHKLKDSCDFLCNLQEKNYQIYYEVDDLKRLNFLVYCSPFQKEIATRYGTIMFLDTIVCTNKYNMPRGIISMQLNNGRILPIIHCLMINQTKETFEKIFKIVFRKFIPVPKVFLTDQDPAILLAVQKIL